MTWNEFIKGLESLDWKQDTPETFNKVEALLKGISQNPEELEKRCQEIVSNPDLLQNYKPHMSYPNKIMDIFVLYLAPDNGFAVRMHRLKTKQDNAHKIPQVHSHEWSYSTLILKGSYQERNYQVNSMSEENHTAQLALIEDHVLTANEINTGMAGTPHITINHEEESCITLFVRGNFQGTGFKVYQMEEGTFTFSDGKFKQAEETVLCRELMRIGRLQS
ncbi:hypothetical protein [Paenibacillus sp. MMS18-CY102]|uniref:hypothetical protein n=1 Tax=Paenibacillus sp. MMS18-CY102 TaxID=2682849 RepID=UPI0013664988|nr:hypothetical protein [Paenibacillus sp. MMS18-CY102]MWC27634.1 hypothetical protein [Paenibacillus sp. MMS18-CY102]